MTIFKMKDNNGSEKFAHPIQLVGSNIEDVKRIINDAYNTLLQNGYTSENSWVELNLNNTTLNMEAVVDYIKNNFNLVYSIVLRKGKNKFTISQNQAN